MLRRDLLKACAVFAAPAIVKSNSSAIRIDQIAHSYQDFRYRAPYKFGGFAVDRVTLLNVECVVSLPNGRSAKGFGSMTMGNVWSFPSHVLSYDQTLNAMKSLAEKINATTAAFREWGHPIDINCALEPEYRRAAAALGARHFLDKLRDFDRLPTLLQQIGADIEDRDSPQPN